MNRAETVSYTHLDVYKRQVLYSCWNRLEMRMGSMNSTRLLKMGPCIRSTSVSYTHLGIILQSLQSRLYLQTTYPSDNVVLKVKSTLETLEYDTTDGHATFTIHIVNGRKNPIVVSPNRFAVKAYDKNNNCIANIFVGSAQGSLNAVLASGDTNPISRGKECTYTVIASGLPVMKAEDTECPVASLRIIYTPVSYTHLDLAQLVVAVRNRF